MKGYIAILAVVLILVVALTSGLAGCAIGKVQARQALLKEAREHFAMRPGDLRPEMGPDFDRERELEFMRKAEKLQRFREFAKEHPEQFGLMMEKRKEEVRERLARLKEENPEKFNRIMQRLDSLEDTLADLKKDLGPPPVK